MTKEHPQTIALVLAHLNSAFAAEVLTCLDRDLQMEVLRRLIDLDEANPEALDAVKRGLEFRLQEHIQGKQRRAAGIATVRQILAAAGPVAEHQLRFSLESFDPSLAGALQASKTDAQRSSKRTDVKFEDLDLLDDPALRRVIGATANQYLVLALAGAPLPLADRMLRLMPSTVAKKLRRAISRLGALPISDLELAAAEMVQRACNLEASGAIHFRAGSAAGSDWR